MLSAISKPFFPINLPFFNLPKDDLANPAQSILDVMLKTPFLYVVYPPEECDNTDKAILNYLYGCSRASLKQYDPHDTPLTKGLYHTFGRALDPFQKPFF
jgi:hypothetical protein